jgi:hypothetical protein
MALHIAQADSKQQMGKDCGGFRPIKRDEGIEARPQEGIGQEEPGESGERA